MTPNEILDRLNEPNIAVERLLDECRTFDLSAWSEHPELYLAFVKRLIEQGHPARALDLAREGELYLKDHSRLQYHLALAAARGGNPRYAESILAPLLSKALGPEGSQPADMNVELRVDIVALQGRVLKDRSTRAPHLAREAANWYETAANLPGATELPDAGTFPLINAATMFRICGDKAKSAQLAAEVVRRIEHLAQAAADAGNVWLAATLGEALLLLNRHDDAIRWYLIAVEIAGARGDIGSLASLRNNLRRLQAAGATATPDFLEQYLGSVVAFSGHMLDSPERQAAGQPPRFPNHPELIADVAAAIRTALDKVNAKVGFCSLACGSDILFAEAMIERNAELHVILPFAIDDFMRTSVDFEQQQPHWQLWRDRFNEVICKVEQASKTRIKYATREPYLGSHELFACCNKILQGLAVLRARERVSDPIGLTVIDRGCSSQSGGAADFAAAWRSAGFAMQEIDLALLRENCSAIAASHEVPAPSLPNCVLKRPMKAMLFADVAGFSGIVETQLPLFLAAYGDYLRELFASPTGRNAVYANTWGDGLFVVFDHAADAAAFAAELVEPTIGRQPDWIAFGLGSIVPFRVGLHSGPVFEITNLFQERSEFGGQHVNRAARIEPVTVRGCVYASEQLASVLIMESPDRFNVEAVGVHSLAKDYDRCALFKLSRG